MPTFVPSARSMFFAVSFPLRLARLLPRVAGAIILALVASKSLAAPRGIYNPLHGYHETPTEDRFGRLKQQIESGAVKLDLTGELPLLRSLLHELDVPVSSQMLVYSVTSLQKALISPKRPRALYFNDDTYVGFVPGGQMEVISIDPRLGGIYYLFDRFKGTEVPRVKRTDECMNCHAPRHMDNVPGLVIESVIPGPTGGGERAFRRQQSGHSVPFEQRFGGWVLTGAGSSFPHNWSNLLIEYRDGQPFERSVAPGELFDFSRYPVQTSDLLPQLLQEHQAGFVNRALQAAYRARELSQGDAAPDAATSLEALAKPVVRYLLFADEAALPPGSVPGDEAFKQAFLSGRRPASNGAALKDLDLSRRLFRYRCSYMIYSPSFTGLPELLKKEALRQLAEALDSSHSPPDYAYLRPEEKSAIRTILRETLPGFPN